MNFLYYNCLKKHVNYRIDLPLEVAEYLAIDLRKLLNKSTIKNETDNKNILKEYERMEKLMALFFLKDKKICEVFLEKKKIDKKFKKQFIASFQTINVKKIKNGDKIFVKPNFLDMFFMKIFPHIKKKFYLFTGASDYEMDDKYLPYIKNNKIIKWIGQNVSMKHNKVVKIPIGFTTKYGESEELLRDLNNKKTNFDYKCNKLLITYAEETHSSRKNIRNLFKNRDWVFFAKKLAFEDYMKKINEYKFVLCPRGNGIDTHRFWETIFMGSIPVVESCELDDLYKNVPCLIVKSFEELKKEDLLEFQIDEILKKNIEKYIYYNKFIYTYIK